MSELGPEQSRDDTYIAEACRLAEEAQGIISDTAARMIASQFHGGQASAMYSLASTGAINMGGLKPELTQTYVENTDFPDEASKLEYLAIYLLHHGDRGPVDGWHTLWGELS